MLKFTESGAVCAQGVAIRAGDQPVDAELLRMIVKGGQLAIEMSQRTDIPRSQGNDSTVPSQTTCPLIFLADRPRGWRANGTLCYASRGFSLPVHRPDETGHPLRRDLSCA